MKIIFILVPIIFASYTYAQNVGIGIPVPSEKLEIASGNVRLSNSDKGIILNNADRPLITRGWNPFTSGIYNGIGRWGLFMEPNRIIIGFPGSGGSGFRISGYSVNSTIIKNVVDVTIDGSSNGVVEVDGRLTRPSTANANLLPIAYGSVRGDGVIRTGTGNFTCTRYASGVYAILVAGETYSPDTHIVQTTILGPSSLFSKVFEVVTYPGSFVVSLGKPDNSGSIDGDFSFVLFKP